MPNHVWSAVPDDALRVIQISDTHLFADPSRHLRQTNTLDSLRQLIEQAIKHGPFDFALATGDLAQQAETAAYQHLAGQLDKLQCPVYCLPGNHDDPARMRIHLRSAYASSPKIMDIGVWRIVLLDSVVPGQSGGHLAPDELDLLQEALREPRPTLVALHHQPVPVGSVSIDSMALDNPADLWRILDRATQVKAVVWGHVHQAFEHERAHFKLLGCPSSCIQFKPDQYDERNTGLLRPGYRLLELLPDGVVNTEVVRTK